LKEGEKMGDQQKKIKGKIEVFIGRTIKVITDIENDEDIINNLSVLEKIKDQLLKFDKIFGQERPLKTASTSQLQTPVLPEDDPYEKIANMLDNVTAVDLRAMKIFSIKDQNVQLLKPNQFKVMDAICVLLFILEVGIGKRDIEYDAFRDIFESQNIKSGSPLTMLMTNMKVAKYIDAKKYSSKIVSLTPKGQEQAIAILNKFPKG